MDRYQKVEKPKPEARINENEIRITSQGLIRNYINYATTLLQERHGEDIVLKAMGQAISKSVLVAEIIKRRFPRFHQDTAISSVSITDVWEPIEEGLEIVEQTRNVSMVSITLSSKELNKNSPGYQSPSHAADKRKHYNNYQPQLPPRQSRPAYGSRGNEDFYDQGRGSDRRGRGWNGRGGYGNYQGNYYNGNYQGNYYNGNYQGNYQENYHGSYHRNYQVNEGYSNWGRDGGRSGWGYRGSGGYAGGGRGGGGRGYGRGRMGNRGPSRGGGGYHDY
ncbi:unnamed protein product [Cuscuta epithymum]|uniref:DNA/RNA-binding protein Alba-like domain-containing protein n=2 Tax=Cuscuta epithymum TaxID=186058 RepID=A0AAV0FF29_9ASTE|nr:unnamed protein product [Cuscuta epithymum]